MLDIPSGPVLIVAGTFGLKKLQQKDESDGADAPSRSHAPVGMVSRFYRQEYVSHYGETFARAVAFVLDRETEFNRDGTVHCERDPSDPGGTTEYGIDAGSHPGVDVADLTEAQAVEIYHRTEWARIRGDGLPSALALSMLDTAVNPGIGLAATWLQLSVRATPDGMIGDGTLRAAHALDTAALKAAALSIQDARAHYYQNRPAELHGHPFRARFLAGWLARGDLTRAAINL